MSHKSAVYSPVSVELKPAFACSQWSKPFRVTVALASLVLVLGATPASANDKLVGVWEQKILSGGQWESGGLYEFEVQPGGKPRMNIIAQPLRPTLINSRGLSNVRVVGDVWTFDSDWGRNGVGSFQLERDSEGRFIGHAYRRQQKLDLNEWVRVGTLLKRDVYAHGGKTVTTYRAKNRLIVTHTTKAPRGSFVASTTTKRDGDTTTLKCVIVEPQGSKETSRVTVHWSVPVSGNAKSSREPGYYLDATRLSLSINEMKSMSKLLDTAIDMSER